jgi:hypothetical protein
MISSVPVLPPVQDLVAAVLGAVVWELAVVVATVPGAVAWELAVVVATAAVWELVVVAAAVV